MATPKPVTMETLCESCGHARSKHDHAGVCCYVFNGTAFNRAGQAVSVCVPDSACSCQLFTTKRTSAPALLARADVRKGLVFTARPTGDSAVKTFRVRSRVRGADAWTCDTLIGLDMARHGVVFTTDAIVAIGAPVAK